MFVVFRVHVRVTFSYSNLHDITKSPLEKSPKSECSCRSVGLHWTCMYDNIHAGMGKLLYMLPSHPTLAESQSFGWGMHCTCMYDSIHTGMGKCLYMLPSHPTLAEFQSFGRGTLTNNNRAVTKDCPSVTIMLSPMFQVIRKQWIQPQLFSLFFKILITVELKTQFARNIHSACLL